MTARGVILPVLPTWKSTFSSFVVFRSAGYLYAMHQRGLFEVAPRRS